MGQLVDLANIERRVSTAEFAFRMDISEKELYARIKDGRLKPGLKDGRKNFWLNSYVIRCVLMLGPEEEGNPNEPALVPDGILPNDTAVNEPEPKSTKSIGRNEQ